MTTRATKIRPRGLPAILETPISTCNSIGLTPSFKTVIVILALWGLLPMAVADWLIHRAGLHND